MIRLNVIRFLTLCCLISAPVVVVAAQPQWPYVTAGAQLPDSRVYSTYDDDDRDRHHRGSRDWDFEFFGPPFSLFQALTRIGGYQSGRLGLGLEIGAGDHASVGPRISGYYRPAKYNDNVSFAAGAGAQATFYLSDPRFQDSWILSPFVTVMRYHLEDDGYVNNGRGTLEDNVAGIEAGMDVGYRWIWNDGLTVRATLGIVYNSIDREHEVMGYDNKRLGIIRHGLPDNEFGYQWEATLGYSF